MSLRQVPLTVPEQIADIYMILRRLRPNLTVEDIDAIVADRPCDCPGCSVMQLEKTFSYEAGLATVHAGDEVWFPTVPIAITSVRVTAKTAPVNGTGFGAGIIVDVNKNGTTVFTDQTHRPTLISGDTTALAPTIDDDTSILGDYYTWDIDQIGDLTPGSDVTITIGYLVDCGVAPVIGPPSAPVLGPCNGPDLPYKTGLQVWLNACSLNLNDGDSVLTWFDISGHGRDFTNVNHDTNVTAKYKTNILNGQPGVLFSSNYLQGPDLSSVLPSATTMFIVWKHHVVPNRYFIFQDSLTFRDGWWRYGGDGAGYFTPFRTARVAGYPSVMPNDTNGHRLTLWSSASNYQVFLDGVDQGNQTASYVCGTSPNINGVYTNDGNAVNDGYVCELILFDSVLSDANRLSIESYLTTKYGL